MITLAQLWLGSPPVTSQMYNSSVLLAGYTFLASLVTRDRQPDLLHVVGARAAPRRFAGSLHRRQQQRDQHADDRDHHQQLDQRKSTLQQIN